MFERMTDRTRRVLVLANAEARNLCHDHIGTEHLLLGLIGEEHGVAALVLASFPGTSLEAARGLVEKRAPRGTGAVPNPPFTERAKKVLELSLRESLQLGHNYIGTEHVLLGMVREGEGVAAQVLVVDLGLDLAKIRQAVIAKLAGYTTAKVKSPERPLATLRRNLIESLGEVEILSRALGEARAVDPTPTDLRLVALERIVAILLTERAHPGALTEDEESELAEHLSVHRPRRPLDDLGYG